METIRFSKVRDVKSPTRGTYRSAGIDFYLPNHCDNDFWMILPNDRILIPSGIKMEVPEGHVLVAFNKSGVSTKKGLDVLACVVDEDYQGEIHLSLYNTTNWPVVLKPGEKIVQFILN